MAVGQKIVTVFGGTGFLGRRVVQHLRAHGFGVRSASRHPGRSRDLHGPDRPGLSSVEADVRDDASVAAALSGADAAVNAVSLYVEQKRDTFDTVHVAAAGRIAAQARQAGLRQLVHVSGIGADPASASHYIRKRGEGEQAVRREFPDATLIRPAVMIGPDDAFLVPVLTLLARLPVYPLFGRGLTRLQPAYVGDVAEAIARVLSEPQPAKTFECAGPRVYTYEELLRIIAREAGLRPVLAPFPFAAWHGLAALAEMLPSPPVTRNQVELMQEDNIAAPESMGLAALGIAPTSVEEVIRMVARPRT